MLLLRRSALSARAACARPAVGANRWAAPRAFSQVPEKNDSTETEYGGVATGEMMRRLSVMIHASHMHVLYARWRFAGMSAAQAARGGDAGGAQGIR